MSWTSRSLVALLLVAAVSACDSPPADGPDAALADAAQPDAAAPDAGPLVEPAADYSELGPHAVGNVRVSVTDAARTRTLPLEIWYPADESARAASDAGQSMAAFETEAPRSTELARLIAEAPATCIRAQTRSAAAPPALAGGNMPLVVFSHCHSCTRFDVAQVAERLASFGIAVAAPDHEDNTLWDELMMSSAAVGEPFLEVRVADIRFVLDVLLDASSAQVPADLRGRFDATRVGVMGHSFGAATSGIVAARDERVIAGLAIAAPLTALGGGARPNTIDTPFLFVVAQEDNSIGAAGNLLIRREHQTLGAPSLLVEVADAGHWSFSDHAGMIELFSAGCGSGTRQTMSGVAFDYVDNALARDLAADLAAAYFARHLLGDEGGLTPILRGHPSGLTTVSYRP